MTLYAQRRQRLAAALAAADLHAAVFNPGPSLRYLFGRSFLLGERPILGLIGADGRATFVAPAFERAEVQALALARAFFYAEAPTTWAQAVAQAFSWLGLPSRARIGIEKMHLRVLELRLLEEAAPQAVFPAADEVIMTLRSRKDETERAALRQAVAIAEAAWQATLPTLQSGQTEAQVANELVLQLLRHGSEPALPFAPLVAFGPHSASPHAQPGAARLQPETLVLFDWGARYQGYVSDLTRLAWFGRQPPADLLALVEVVRRANRAGVAAAQVGATAGSVDDAARGVIRAAGYGPAFLHRTGHGLGLEVHEPPYLRSDNPQPLAAGMVFTVEPGVYLEGRWGVRLEDMVLVTEAGPRLLTTLSHEVRLVTPS